MGKEFTNDYVLNHKNQALKKLDETLDKFINSCNEKYVKKANLISYWIETFCDYVLQEEAYDYNRIPSYDRGDILHLNFGFNVGSEQGGLHYAVVLDNNNNKNSKVITVVPLSSGTEEETYERDIYLGNELYEKLKQKYESLYKEYETKRAKYIEKLENITTIKSKLENLVENKEKKDDIINIIDNMENQLKNDIKNEEELLRKYEKDINKLKKGSIALMEQITTISKMRIYSPKNSHDLLYGIKLSESGMNKINDLLKKLYVFNK